MGPMADKVWGEGVLADRQVRGQAGKGGLAPLGNGPFWPIPHWLNGLASYSFVQPIPCAMILARLRL